MSLAEQSRFTALKITGRLPTPRGVALEVINLTQREDAPNHEIVRLISTDAALSVRVIKAANVLLGYISRPVATVDDAVMVLGARTLRQLVLGIALMLDYRHGPCKPFDYGRFWAHSLLTAIAARHLARRLHLSAPDQIFMVGLLGDVGQLALATVYADEYGALIGPGAGHSWAELQQRECEKFGFDERELSAAILADIHFPAIFQTLVRDYRQPETSPAVQGSREWQLLYLLHSAALLAEVCLASREQRGKLVSRLRFQALCAGIEADALIEVGEASLRDWPEWSALLGMGALETRPFAELLQEDDGVAEASAAVAGAQHEAALPGAYPLRVLLVEDDRVMAALLESQLRHAGHTVYSARNGAQALAMLAQHPPQLVIADWLMPELDGISLCRALRASVAWRDVYFIVMDARQDTDRLVQAFAAGADDYLAKPLDPRILFARLHAAMRVVKLQQALQRRAERNP